MPTYSGDELLLDGNAAQPDLGAPVPTDIRKHRRERFAEWFLLVLYAIAVGFTVTRHEPWADEAQAWLIAKALPFWRMLLGQVRYEGTPGLWHSILWALSHAGLPYASMFWFSWAAAVAGAWVLLTYSPFPLFLRALIPFTFYLSYQFAIVARSYVLMPVLIFTAVHLLRNHPRRAFFFSLVTGLLANCNLFGLFISSGLVLVYLWQNRNHPARFVLFAKVLAPWLLFVAAAVAIAIPPKDLRFVPTPLGDALARHRGLPVPPPIGGSYDPPLRQRVQEYTTPLSHSLWLGALFLGVIVWQAARRHTLIALVPVACLIVSFELVYKMPRHTGLFLLVLIAALWLVWPDRTVPLRRYLPPDLACAAIFLLICLPQVAWAIRAIHYDATQNYSGSRACADYLKTHAAGRKVCGYDYFTVAVSAFFDAPIFQNQPTQYWSWSNTNTTDLQMNRIVFERPDYVVLSWHQNAQFGYLISTTLSPSAIQMQDYLRATGYTRAALFTGSQVMRSSFAERDFFEVYRRPDISEAQWSFMQYRLYDPPGIQH